MSSDTNILSQYDDLLKDEADIAAIVIRERLRPVQGPRGVFFPPTFAAIGQGKKSDYHIDRIGPQADDPEGATRAGIIGNRCTVDSVPSQANRLENRLLRYSGTYIPKVSISGSRVGEQLLDLLEVGHRVADAVLRYTAGNGYEPFREALRAFVGGDAAPLARLAPTSLVFGHWDSRPGGTKSKARRILRSEIVAYNVARATKRSQYWSSIDPEVNEELGQILAEAKEAASRDPETKNPASQLGMTDVPAPESPGGVIAFGKIERTSMIALSGLRSLAAFRAPTSAESEASAAKANAQAIDPNQTLALRRYLFALSLAAVADPGVWDLREGCILVRNGPPPVGDLSDGEAPITATQVRFNGEEQSFTLPLPNDVEAYLRAATDAFFQNRLPEAVQLTFAPKLAYAAVAERKTKKDFVERLAALQDYAGREAELKQKGLRELKKLWQEKQAAAAGPEDSGGSGGDSSPMES